MRAVLKSRLTAYHRLVPAENRVVYVRSGAAAVGADGRTLRTAWGSIEIACDHARPGDRILVAPGIYGYVNIYDVRARADAWISIEALDLDDLPVIDVSQEGTNGIDIQQSHHVALFGFRVRSSREASDVDASGICVFRGSAFIRIWACDVRDFPGGGINCFWVPQVVWDSRTLPAGGWDCVDVSFNLVAGCCRFSPFNTSGLSFFGAEELSEATLEGGVGYRVRGNVVRDCRCLVPYSPGGLQFVTDGNGISADSLFLRNNLTTGLAPYVKWGVIEENVAVFNGGRGIHIYNTTNVRTRKNACAGNLRTSSPAFRGANEVDVTFNAAGWDSPPTVDRSGDLVPPRLRSNRRPAEP